MSNLGNSSLRLSTAIASLDSDLGLEVVSEIHRQSLLNMGMSNDLIDKAIQQRAIIADNRLFEVAAQRADLFTRTVLVVPEFARYILEHHNICNRHPTRSKVEAYKKAMLQNRFIFHSQGISFTREPRLNNGQNRLRACLEAGVPYLTILAFNEDRNAFKALDAGQNRSKSDALYIAVEELRRFDPDIPPMKNEKKMTAVAKAAMLGLNGLTANGAVDNDELVEFFMNHRGVIEEFSVQSQKVASTAVVGAFINAYLKGGYLKKDVLAALKVYATGHGTRSEKDPLLVLKNRLTKTKHKNSAAYAAAVAGIWHYMDGRESMAHFLEALEDFDPSKRKPSMKTKKD